MAEIKKQDCKYGEKCYQKNPAHHVKYNHPFKVNCDGAEKNSSGKDNINDLKREGLSAELCGDTKKLKANENVLKTDENTKAELNETSENAECSNKDALLREQIPNSEIDITEEYKEVMQNLSNSNYFEIFQRRVRYSQKAEYDELLKTPEVFIRHKFLVEMPGEFYIFWEFCKSFATGDQKPEEVFEKFGLKCVGPFDYLAGKFDKATMYSPGDYLRHWRFFFDPPEFQSIFVKANTGVHFGYWRDDPKDKENLLMARNDAGKSCEFKFVGANCFETVLYYLDNEVQFTPFNRKDVSNVKKSIENFAKEKKIQLDKLDSEKRNRSRKAVCTTFHKAGLVVPYNKKEDIGYRSLIETDGNLKKILEKFERAKGDKDLISAAMENLQPIITAANIAVDERDTGTVIELGIDLFCSGYKELHQIALLLLNTGYSQLQKPQFIAIIKSHLENRSKSFDLSILQ